jgi:hypothetical protein
MAGALAAPAMASIPSAPRHVIVTQGPTDPAALRTIVTWDRSDPDAVAYRVVRDGREIARVAVSGDAWDDLILRDTQIEAGRSYAYQVRAEARDGSLSASSPAYRVRVRSDAQIGAAASVAVDDFAGTDSERAAAAVRAAAATGGGVVKFAARTYTLDQPLVVADDDIVLRGAGAGRTILQPSFAGAPDACAPPVSLVTFTGDLHELPTRLAAAALVGTRTVQVASAVGLAAGDVVIFNQAPEQTTPDQYAAAGVLQDPVRGRDRRHAWEANEIVAVTGTAVTFRNPLAYAVATDTPWLRIDRGRGDGIERLTLQGRGPQEDSFYQLLSLDQVAHAHVADIEARWANRSFVQARGYDLRFVGFRGPSGGPRSFDGGACKYKLSFVRAANVIFVDGQMGDPVTDENQSFITIQRAQRIVIRSSIFHGSRTYAVDEHGGGSQDLVFENNLFAAGPGARYGAILLGSSTWGFSGPVIIRNNLFRDNSRDLYGQENSYEIRMLDNVSVGNRRAFVEAYGWAGPDTPADRRGSLRMTVSRNAVTGAMGNGIVLGGAASPWYPFAGVRDVRVTDNALGVAGTAIALAGAAPLSQRFQVIGNTGSAAYVRPGFLAGDYWHGNADGVSYGTATSTGWSSTTFAWENFDRGVLTPG